MTWVGSIGAICDQKARRYAGLFCSAKAFEKARFETWIAGARMKLKALHIKNFRAFKDETINFNDYTVFVGPNGVGKSTVLAALNVLFREKDNAATDTAMLEEQDFHNGNVEEPIEIVATFDSLSDEAKEDLKDYVRHDQLIVAAVAKFDRSVRRADVKQYGERLSMEAFARFFEAQNNGEKVSALKEIYKEIRALYRDLPTAGTGPTMTEALRSYEEAHGELCTPLRSGTTSTVHERGDSIATSNGSMCLPSKTQKPSR